MSIRCSLRSAVVSAVLVSLVGGTAAAADAPVPVRQSPPNPDTFDFTIPVQLTNVNASGAHTFHTVSVFCGVSTGLTTSIIAMLVKPSNESTGAPGRVVASGESPAQPLKDGSFNGSIRFTLTASDKRAAPEAHSYACHLLLDHQLARNEQAFQHGTTPGQTQIPSGADEFVPGTFKPVAQGQIH